MASPSCSFSARLDGATACGLSRDYPTQVEVVSLKDCTRDVSRHLQLNGLSADNALGSECNLLLARAGNMLLFIFIPIIRRTVLTIIGLLDIKRFSNDFLTIACAIKNSGIRPLIFRGKGNTGLDPRLK